MKKLQRISRELGSLKSQIDEICGGEGEGEEEDYEDEDEEEMGMGEEEEEPAPKSGGKKKKVDLMIAFLDKKKK